MSRDMLLRSKLPAFTAWVAAKGYQSRPGRGVFQVVQILIAEGLWVGVYSRAKVSNYYTVDPRLEQLVYDFYRDTPQLEAYATDAYAANPHLALKAQQAYELRPVEWRQHIETLGQLVAAEKANQGSEPLALVTALHLLAVQLETVALRIQPGTPVPEPEEVGVSEHDAEDPF